MLWVGGIKELGHIEFDVLFKWTNKNLPFQIWNDVIRSTRINYNN